MKPSNQFFVELAMRRAAWWRCSNSMLTGSDLCWIRWLKIMVELILIVYVEILLIYKNYLTYESSKFYIPITRSSFNAGC